MTPRPPESRPRPAWYLVLLGVLAVVAPLLACSTSTPGAVVPLRGQNAYWNCPTRTPHPTPPPVPTTCIPYSGPTPGPGTPWPTPACTAPQPPPTPWPTITPYGRWLQPDARGSSATFYRAQDVRIGPLRLTLQDYRTTGPIPNGGGAIAHVFTFATANEGPAVLTVTWPLQLLVREVTGTDGTTTTGTWGTTWRAQAAAGLPAWTDAQAVYAPGTTRQIAIAVAAPPGTAHAVGFLPDPWGGDDAPRNEVGAQT
jgi:hypothetical protein